MGISTSAEVDSGRRPENLPTFEKVGSKLSTCNSPFLFSSCGIFTKLSKRSWNPPAESCGIFSKNLLKNSGNLLTNARHCGIISPVGRICRQAQELLRNSCRFRVANTSRKWRNWQTRTFEGRVVHTVRVQVPFLAKEKGTQQRSFFFAVRRIEKP